MGPIISVFVLVLIVSILAGLTFLFIASLKSQAHTIAPYSDAATVTNESLAPTDLGTALSVNSYRDCTGTVTNVFNASSKKVIAAGNYSITGCTLKNLTSEFTDKAWNVSFTWIYTPFTTAESAVNGTESAGYTVIGYLPLIFLAIIFGALLTLVLKIILPYINLGQQTGGF